MSARPSSPATPPRVERFLDLAVGPLHRAPDFLIIGAARSGTTAMLHHISRTPGALRCPIDEIHYFDGRRYRRRYGWYRRHFPWQHERLVARLRGRGPGITGESSPYYIAHPESPERIREVLPDVRLLALLRDPTDRAISHWNWRLTRGNETRDFADVVQDEVRDPPRADEVMGRGAQRFERYITRGIYLPQLQRWHATFPREQLLTLISEHFFKDPLAEMRRVWAHLGLRPMTQLPAVPRNARTEPAPVDEALIQELRAFYRPHNAALAEYLGVELPWS